MLPLHEPGPELGCVRIPLLKNIKTIMDDAACFMDICLTINKNN